MDPNQKVVLTKEGLAELKAEYDEIVHKKRPAMVARLANARDQGDLSENSEYAAAKEDLAFIDGRIAELEEILHSAKVAAGHKKGQVDIGCKVTLSIDGKKEQFTLVGEWEADLVNKKISHASPLGMALMGKKEGDSVHVEAPAGKILYKILHIE